MIVAFYPVVFWFFSIDGLDLFFPVGHCWCLDRQPAALLAPQSWIGGYIRFVGAVIIAGQIQFRSLPSYPVVFWFFSIDGLDLFFPVGNRWCLGSSTGGSVGSTVLDRSLHPVCWRRNRCRTNPTLTAHLYCISFCLVGPSFDEGKQP